MALSTREVFMVLRARDEASRVLRGFSQNLKGVDKQTMKTAQVMAQHGQAMSSVGIGLAAAGVAAASFFKTAVDASIEYGRQAAYTKTQTDKVKVSIEQLKDIGREVGASIPTDFDHIQTSLYDIFSSIDVNLPQAKRLLKEFAYESVAGQESLQEAGKGTIGIMNAFKIPIEKVRTVSDTMFQLVRKGVGTYQQFNRTIGRAVPSAVRAGQSFQDLAGMMAFLTRNGLSAAMASASAGRALDAFSNPKVVGRLEKMGIAVRNAKGEFLPISGVVAALGKKLEKLTGPERAAALQDLFKGAGGTIQARRFYDIAVKNYDKLIQYTDYMKKSKGALSEAYDTMFHQPQSQAILLSNNMKILKTIVGDALLPAWLKLTTAIITAVKWFNNLSPHTKNLITKLAALGATLAIVIGGLLTVAGILTMFAAGWIMAGGTILGLVTAVGIAIGVIIALGVAIFLVVKYHKQIWAFMKKVWKDAVSLFQKAKAEIIVFGQTLEGFGRTALRVFTDIGKWIWEKIGGPLTEVAGWFAQAGRFFAKLGKDIWEGIVPPVLEIWAAIRKGVDKAWPPIKKAIQDFAAGMKPVIDSLWAFAKNVRDIFKYIWENGVKPVLEQMVDILKWSGERFMDLMRIVKFVASIIGNMLYGAIMVIIGVFKFFASILSNVLPPVLELVGKLIGRLIGIFKGVIQFVVGVFTGNWKLAWKGIQAIFSNTLKAIGDILVGAIRIIVGFFKGLVEGIIKLAKWLWDKLVGHSIFPDIVNAIVGLFKYLLYMGPRLFKLMGDAIVGLVSWIFGVVKDLAAKIPQPFINAGQWLVKRGQEFVTGLKNGIWAISKTIATWAYNNVIKPLTDRFANAISWLTNAGKNVINGFLSGMQAAWKAVTDWVGGIASWIKDHKGPISLDGRLLIPAGRAIMSGFLKGLKSGAGPAWDFVTRVGGKSKDALMSVLTGGPSRYAKRAGVTGINGEILDNGTYDLLRMAEQLLGRQLHLVQGSFSTRVGASGSTHAGAGAMDVTVPRGVSWEAAVAALRQVGFAAWHRTPAQGPWGHHIHAIARGAAGLSAAAARQVQDYLRGGDGLGRVNNNVPSFAKGAWKILQNQMAYLHRGEMVVPRRPAESIRKGYDESSRAGVSVPITIYTQEIDPRKHAADLGWEFASRVN